MEIIYSLLGLVAIYSFIHSIVIVVKKIGSLTLYEKIVLWTGVVMMSLILIGLT